jgi:creatinine amidohydrolase
MKKNVLANLTWQELDEMKREDCIVLIPLGSTEQQGSHLPLGVDTYVAERVAMNVAEKTGALVTPTITVGYSAWFMEFPGTITLKMETLTQLIREYCESLILHGFRKFVFITGHGGNTTAIDLLAREWKLHFDLVLSMVEIWKIANALARKCETLKEKAFKHGGEIMTSMMMAIDPDLVDMKRARVEYLKSSRPAFVTKSTLGGVEFEGIEINLYEKAKSCTTTGIMGDPMGASSETGRWLLNEIELYLERMIRNL